MAAEASSSRTGSEEICYDWEALAECREPKSLDLQRRLNCTTFLRHFGRKPGSSPSVTLWASGIGDGRLRSALGDASPFLGLCVERASTGSRPCDAVAVANLSGQVLVLDPTKVRRLDAAFTPLKSVLSLPNYVKFGCPASISVEAIEELWGIQVPTWVSLEHLHEGLTSHKLADIAEFGESELSVVREMPRYCSHVFGMSFDCQAGVAEELSMRQLHRLAQRAQLTLDLAALRLLRLTGGRRTLDWGHRLGAVPGRAPQAGLLPDTPNRTVIERPEEIREILTRKCPSSAAWHGKRFVLTRAKFLSALGAANLQAECDRDAAVDQARTLFALANMLVAKALPWEDFLVACLEWKPKFSERTQGSGKFFSFRFETALNFSEPIEYAAESASARLDPGKLLSAWAESFASDMGRKLDPDSGVQWGPRRTPQMAYPETPQVWAGNLIIEPPTLVTLPPSGNVTSCQVGDTLITKVSGPPSQRQSPGESNARRAQKRPLVQEPPDPNFNLPPPRPFLRPPLPPRQRFPVPQDWASAAPQPSHNNFPGGFGPTTRLPRGFGAPRYPPPPSGGQGPPPFGVDPRMGCRPPSFDQGPPPFGHGAPPLSHGPPLFDQGPPDSKRRRVDPPRYRERGIGGDDFSQPPRASGRSERVREPGLRRDRGPIPTSFALPNGLVVHSSKPDNRGYSNLLNLHIQRPGKVFGSRLFIFHLREGSDEQDLRTVGDWVALCGMSRDLLLETKRVSFIDAHAKESASLGPRCVSCRLTDQRKALEFRRRLETVIPANLERFAGIQIVPFFYNELGQTLYAELERRLRCGQELTIDWVAQDIVPKEAPRPVLHTYFD